MADCDVTPEDYPAECTISAEELCELKEALTTNEDWRSYTEEWPPTDNHGDVFPIWFTVDELNGRGELIDSRGNNYDPFTGNMTPYDTEKADYCNAPLTNWRERYPSIRYCSIALNPDYGYDIYCHTHQGYENVTMKSAEEHLQTGLFTKTVDHFYAKIDGWKKLTGWGIFESLMGQSKYDFGVEYREETIDFSDEEVVPEDVDEDGKLTVKAGYPTEHVNPAINLYVAAMQSIQMLAVQPRIMYEDREEGEGMMESREVQNAQLTAPTESNPHQNWKTLEGWTEHHLNLPFSRVVRDQSKLLERGGVVTDPEADTDEIDEDDVVLEIAAESEIEGGERIEADPNQFEDMTPQSQRIIDSARGDGNTDATDTDDGQDAPDG